MHLFGTEAQTDHLIVEHQVVTSSVVIGQKHFTTC